MNTYEKIVNILAETNNISLEDVRVNVQFSKYGGRHIQEYTYIILPQKDGLRIPKEVWDLLGNPRPQTSFKWGYIIEEFKLEDELAKELYEEEEQYKYMR